MPRILKYLIKASGNTGTSGQSFRNHVNGAASGVKMTDYLIGNANFFGPLTTGTPGSPEGPYNDNTTYDIVVNLNTFGSRATYIQKTITTIGNWGTGTGGGIGSFASIDSITSTGPNNATVTIRIKSAQKSGATISGNSRYLNSTPSSNGVEPVYFYGSVANPSGTPVTTLNISLNYIPDIGPFNPTVGNGSGWYVNFYDRDVLATDYDWEWYLNSTDQTNGTNIFATGEAIVVNQVPPCAQLGGTLPLDPEFYLYPRIRPLGGVGLWTNLAGVRWFDNRSGV